jgi:hypothetical protein
MHRSPSRLKARIGTKSASILPGLNGFGIVFALALVLSSVYTVAFAANTSDGMVNVNVALSGRPEVTASSYGYQYRWEGLQALSDAGRPELPYRDIQILLPPGTRAAHAVVNPVMIQSEDLSVRLANATALISSEGQSISTTATPGSAANFPSVWGELLGTHVWHGRSIATVRLYPVRVLTENSADGSAVLWADTFEVRLGTRASDMRVTASLRGSGAGDTQRWANLTAAVVNPMALSSYPVLQAGKAAAEYPGFAPTDAPSLDGSPVDYVIVTTDEFAGLFQEFADYKTQRGIPTVVKTLSWIRDNYQTSDGLSAMIRDFLRDAYTYWGTGYVLLGADVEFLPTKMIYNSLYPSGVGSQLPVDHYYAGLDGDWNADCDEIPGEPSTGGQSNGDDVDLAPELHVGRAPVKSLDDVQIFIHKIMAYERDEIGDYLGNFLFMSEVLSPSEYQQGGEIVTDGATYSEAIIDGLLAGKSIGYDRYYEADSEWPGSFPETKTNVISAMDSGQYGFVNHIGHGFFDVMSVGDSSLVLRDARNLVNTPKYFILTNVNCASAAFDYNSIIERFITTADGGAVLSIGSSRAAFPTIATQFQYNLYEAILEQGARTAGEAFTLSRAPFLGAAEDNTIERWTMLTLALIGDPTLRLWTAAPDSLTVTAPADLTIGAHQITISVERAGTPLADATVCLSKGDDCYVVGTTDVAGQVLLDVSIASFGEAVLSVETQNSAVFMDTLTVVDSGAHYLGLAGITLFDDGSYGSVGNGDGLADAGETVALLPEFANDSGLDASATTQIDLLGAYAGVTPLVSVCTAPPLLIGERGEADTALLLQLDVSITDRTRLPLQFASDDSGQTLDDTFTLEVLAPAISPAVITWSDVTSGNGNSIIEDGEMIRVWLSLRNDGAGAVHGLTGWLETDTFGIDVAQDSATWPDITSFGEMEQDAELLLSIFSIQTGYQAVLHIADSYGREWIHTFNLVVPDQLTMGTLTAPGSGAVDLTWPPSLHEDILGYHVYRSLSPNFGYERITDRPTSGALYQDSGLSALTKYYYKVTVVTESRLESRQSSAAYLHTEPGSTENFPAPMKAETSSHVALGDIDGDGLPEIITAADAIYAWHDDGNEVRDGDGDATSIGPFLNNGEIWTPAGVTLGDLTDDPGLEIVASCRSTMQIYVLEADGTVATGWPQPLNNWNWSTPAVGDLDNDGDNEIVVTSVQGITYAWHHDGVEFLDGDADPVTQGVFHVRPTEWYQFGSPVLADVDDDTTLEILVGTRNSDGSSDLLHALRNDGTDAAGWPYDLGAWNPTLTSPAVGDMDQDGVLEIVFISENDLLHVIDQFGATVAPFPLPLAATGAEAGFATPSPALGDLDDDGILDIVAVEVENKLLGYVHAYSLAGDELPGWPRQIEGNSESSPIIGDVSGDGLPDVIFGIGGGSDSTPNKIYGFRSYGDDLKGFPIARIGPVRATPTLADIGGDGDVDLVYAGWDLSLNIWELNQPYNPAAMPWPTFQGNMMRTGVWAPYDPETSVAEADIPLRLDLAQNIPNPFNPVTRIAFTLPTDYDGRVTLCVYDLLGRRVRTLLDDDLEGGIHTVTWQGRDDTGRTAASGIYLYRLDSDVGQRHGRMTLVK